MKGLKMPKIQLCKGDLPTGVRFNKSVAIDTETMGLNLHRDRLCLVQLSDDKGNVYLVQIQKGKKCPNLIKLLTDKTPNSFSISIDIIESVSALGASASISLRNFDAVPSVFIPYSEE